MKHKKPEFYKALHVEGFFEQANKKLRFHSSTNYWHFYTGDWVYKIKKPFERASAVDMEAVYVAEIQSRLQQSAPGLESCPMMLTGEGETWQLGSDLARGGLKSYHVLKQRQLNAQGFLDGMLDKGKIKQDHAQALGAWLAQYHAKAAPAQGKEKDLATDQVLVGLLEGDIFQAKKLLGKPLTQAQINLTLHPFKAKAAEAKKVLGKRFRQGRVIKHHGGLTPSKIHFQGKEIQALALSGDPLQNPYLDMASDVADVPMALRLQATGELADLVVAQYLEATENENLLEVLPLFEILKALKHGFRHQMLGNDPDDEAAEQHLEKAKAHFALMVELARKL